MNADAICWDNLLRANQERNLRCKLAPSMVPGNLCGRFAGKARGFVESGCPNERRMYGPGPTARGGTGQRRTKPEVIRVMPPVTGNWIVGYGRNNACRIDAPPLSSFLGGAYSRHKRLSGSGVILTNAVGTAPGDRPTPTGSPSRRTARLRLHPPPSSGSSLQGACGRERTAPSAHTLQRLAHETGRLPSTTKKVLRLPDLLQQIARDGVLSAFERVTHTLPWPTLRNFRV